MDFVQALLYAAEMAKSARSLTQDAKGIFDTLKPFFEKAEASGDPDMKAAIADLTTKVSDAALANAQLYAELTALRLEMQNVAEAERKLDRYEFWQSPLGDVALRLKEAKAEGEPIHYICADCAEDGRRYFLQGGPDMKACNNCGQKVRLQKARPHQKTAIRTRR